MTRQKRIEAAAMREAEEQGFAAWADMTDTERQDYREWAEAILRAAYPELASGTHVLVPKEPVVDVLVAAMQQVGDGHITARAAALLKEINALQTNPE